MAYGLGHWRRIRSWNSPSLAETVAHVRHHSLQTGQFCNHVLLGWLGGAELSSITDRRSLSYCMPLETIGKLRSRWRCPSHARRASGLLSARDVVVALITTRMLRRRRYGAEAVSEELEVGVAHGGRS
jgi:hypothetical protein